MENIKTMHTGLVSTIIPVFNRPKMLAKAVQSVVEQDYRPIEIIVVDDGSTDETKQVAQQLVNKHSCVKLISITNSGPGTAREAGRIEANGEFIQYLDSDDVLLPTKFSKQVRLLKNELDSGVCYCKTNLQMVSEGKVLESWKRTGEKIEDILPAMFASRWWGTSSPLYRSEVLNQVGAWNAWINEEDWEYDCRVGLVNGKLSYVPEVLSVQYQHDAPNLSDDGAQDPVKLASRAMARRAIIEHALTCKRARNSDELVILLKYSFLLSRQCAAAGLKAESKELFLQVKKHLINLKKNKVQLAIYHLGALLIGWVNMGKLSKFSDRLRT